MNNSEYLNTAIKAVKIAGNISLKYFNSELEINYKEKNEIVTNVDKLCEEEILKIISKKYPKHDIWSEENGETKKKSKYRWVIDPIDGTYVFSRGIETYGISIALELNEETIVGVNYFPALKKMYYAEKNKGSYLNGKRIFISKKSNIKPLYLICSEMTRNPNLMRKFLEKNKNKEISVKDFGSTTFNLSLLAEGKADVCYSYNIKPGDVSVGILLIREAGGYVINKDGLKAKSKDSRIISYSKFIKKNDII